MKLGLALIIGLGAVSAAHADMYSWVKWTGMSGSDLLGTIATSNGTVNVTVSGPFDSYLTDYPTWTPAATYADGVMIDNAPDNTSLVKIKTTGNFKVAFDQNVSDVAFSLWSVGQTGVPVTYAFDQTPTFVSGGAGTEFGGQAITVLGNDVTGVEGNGTVKFGATMSALNFDVQNTEDYHGFNLGLKSSQPVPEPATLLALGAGLVGFARKRSKK